MVCNCCAPSPTPWRPIGAAPPHWSEQHDAIVTDRIEGRFRLGIRLSDFTALLIDRDGTLTRCGLDGLPGVAAGQTLLRAIQGHFGLHGHTLVRVPTATFNAHPVREALAEGSPAAALAAAALAEGHLS